MRGNPPGADLGMPVPKAPLPELPAPVPFSISLLLICPFHILTDTPPHFIATCWVRSVLFLKAN